jgi:hypothetical protein
MWETAWNITCMHIISFVSALIFGLHLQNFQSERHLFILLEAWIMARVIDAKGSLDS